MKRKLNVLLPRDLVGEPTGPPQRCLFFGDDDEITAAHERREHV
jgi:hypothetical protein